MFARLLAARVRASEVVSVRISAAAEVAHRTHIGVRIEQHAATSAVGGLLPSSLVLPLVQSRLKRAQSSGEPIVLSGFPRTLDQLLMLQHAGLGTPQLLHLDLSREDSEQRVANRRVCASCGDPMYPPFNGNAEPDGLPEHFIETECDAEKPIIDLLDAEPALGQRLDDFDNFTVPLINQLRQRGAVHDIPFHSDADATWKAVQAAYGLTPM